MLKKALISLLVLLVSGATGAGHPLEPSDTSSPRATMESFLALTDEAARRLVEYRDAPSPATQKALMQAGLKIRRLFDLSQVPPTARHEVAGAMIVKIVVVFSYAASSLITSLDVSSLSGLSHTSFTGDQSLVSPLQRSGCRSFAAA